ncbi:MAG TPA: response regulator [Polyangiaceae bacterium]
MSVPDPSRILIVDDNDDGRSLMKQLLEENGFEVSEAGNGGAALDLLESEVEPELIVLDLEMPVMSGGELLAAMKKDERLSRLPVVIVSGSARTTVPSDNAIVGVFSKPLLGDDFVATVKRCVAVARSRDGNRG